MVLLLFFNGTATAEIYTLSLHDALPISAARLDRHGHEGPAGLPVPHALGLPGEARAAAVRLAHDDHGPRRLARSEEHTSELQSRQYLVCRLLLEKQTRKLTTLYYYAHTL